MIKKTKRSQLIVLILCITVVVSGLVLVGLLIHNQWQKSQTMQIDGRPAEHLIESILSPDGLHRLDAYWNDGRGATVAESSVVIITANENGMKWEGKSSWCLYFAYHYPDITAEWIDNETVKIHNTLIHQNDGFVTLNIYQDEYSHMNSADQR